jgi:hypothetical protein
MVTAFELLEAKKGVTGHAAGEPFDKLSFRVR